MSVLDFLTGGTFNSLKDLLIFVLNFIIRFISNVANIFIEPILNKIDSFIPNIDPFVSTITNALDFILDYCNYIIDFSLIPKPVLILIITSIIFRIVVNNSTFVTKLILKWYNILKP